MLKDILAISGQSGLYKVVSKGSKNLIVESLDNGRRFPAHSANKIISLEDIAIFTLNGEVPLREVFKKIAEKEDFKASLDPKSSGVALKKYFEEVLPEYDQDRVYVSDIKKVLLWYNILQASNMLQFDDEENENEASDEKQADS